METLLTPIIPIHHLKNKEYQYKYHITDAFLEEFPHSQIQNANLEAIIQLEKSETLLRLKIDINGVIVLICDRSLDEFEYPIHTHENMLYQFAEKTEWIEDNLILLGYDTFEIDLQQLMYELIHINIPLKKLHPRFENETYQENEEGEMLVYTFSTDGIIDKIEPTEPTENPQENTEIDPRWADLKKLLNNN